MAERTLRGSRLAPEHGDRRPRRPQRAQITTYVCPHGHTHRAALLRRGRHPAHLGVPLRRGGPARSTAPSPRPSRSSTSAPTGTCCSSVAPSPSSRSSSRSASPSCASRAARSRAASAPPEPDAPKAASPIGGPAFVMSGSAPACAVDDLAQSTTAGLEDLALDDVGAGRVAGPPAVRPVPGRAGAPATPTSPEQPLGDHGLEQRPGDRAG